MNIQKSVFIVMILILGFNLSALEKAPDFKLENMKGKQVKLSEFLEEGLVILDFWATWCAPCKKALPELNRINEEFEKVNVVTICTDKPRKIDKAKSYIKSNKYKFQTLFDSNKKVTNLYKVTNIPRTFLIAPDGTILSDHLGYKKGDEKHLEEEIHKWFERQKKVEETEIEIDDGKVKIEMEETEIDTEQAESNE